MTHEAEAGQEAAVCYSSRVSGPLVLCIGCFAPFHTHPRAIMHNISWSMCPCQRVHPLGEGGEGEAGETVGRGMGERGSRLHGDQHARF